MKGSRTGLAGTVASLLILAPALCAAPSASGQVGEAWVARYHGPGNSWDKAHAIAVDPAGNIYVTGGSVGVGTESDYCTLKYNRLGNVLWIARYDGPDHLWEDANALALDRDGNVYITGLSYGRATNYDIATVKYDPKGNELWAGRYAAPGPG